MKHGAIEDEDMTMTLADLPKDSARRLNPFQPKHIAALEASITLKEAGKAAVTHVTCLVRCNRTIHRAGSPNNPIEG